MNDSKFPDFKPGEMSVITGRPNPHSSAAILAEIRSKFGLPKEANAVRPNERRAGRLDHMSVESPTRQIMFGVMLEIGDPGMPAALAAYADECRKRGKRDQAHRFLEMLEAVHRYQRFSGISALAAFERKREEDDQLARHPEIQRTKDEEMRRSMREAGERLGDPYDLSGPSRRAIDGMKASRDISAGEPVNGEAIDPGLAPRTRADGQREYAERRYEAMAKDLDAKRAAVIEAEQRLADWKAERNRYIERDSKFEAEQKMIAEKEKREEIARNKRTDALIAKAAAQDEERDESSLSAFLGDRFVQIAKRSAPIWSEKRGPGISLDLQYIDTNLARKALAEAIAEWRSQGFILNIS